MSKEYTDKWCKESALAVRGGVPPASLPPPPPKKHRKNEEFQLQCELVRWWSTACKTFNIPEFLLWHTPNSAVYGGPREQREKMGAMLKRVGQRSGVCDLTLAVPRLNRPEKLLVTNGYVDIKGWHHALFLELKARKGTLSPEQICFKAALEEQGYKVCVVRTVEEGVANITEYLQ